MWHCAFAACLEVHLFRDATHPYAMGWYGRIGCVEGLKDVDYDEGNVILLGHGGGHQNSSWRENPPRSITQASS